MKKCPFCENQITKFKTDSHIIPKWMRRLSFGKQSTTYNVDLEESRIVIAQDGVKDDFICEECEKLFAKDDEYASFVFKQDQVNPSVVNIANTPIVKVNCDRGYIDALELRGMDFKKLQKFVFSVVLREHMYRLLKGKNLLGDKHFLRMKQIYDKDQNLDDTIYPILINAIDKNDLLWATVQYPYRGKSLYGQNLITFMGGGYEFNVIVQSHNIPADALGFRLTSSGEAIIPIIPISTKKSAQNALVAAKKLRRAKGES